MNELLIRQGGYHCPSKYSIGGWYSTQNQYKHTAVPLLKDTLWRGHPSRKDTNSWQQVLVL